MAKEEPILLTRSGYEVSEAFHSYGQALTESGATAIGKALHFGADLVCSEGFDIWMKVGWDYAIFHVGLASPRIFVYLRKRFSELERLVKKMPSELLYQNEEFQTRVSEIILIIHGCPRRPPIKWPIVSPETHQEEWIRNAKEAPDVGAVNRVWKYGVDMPQMKIAACEIVKACTDGATEKALFWVRWLLEEDSLMRKINHGTGLSTVERGISAPSARKRTDMGYFLLAVFAEVYKELAAREVVRMHEEFQTLIDIWRNGMVPLTAKQKREILGLVVLLIAEVPRWKVPAAPTLVKDPVQLSRAVGQAHRFFTEVLAFPPVSKGIVKTGSKKKRTVAKKESEKEKKQEAFEKHLDAYDQAITSYLGLD